MMTSGAASDRNTPRIQIKRGNNRKSINNKNKCCRISKEKSEMKDGENFDA